MSLLLDALKKADEERKRSDGTPSIDSLHENKYFSEKRKIPSVLIAFIAGILFIALLISVYWLGQKTQQPVVPINIATDKNSLRQTASNTPTLNTEPSRSNPNTQQQLNSTNKAPQNIHLSDDNSVASLYQQNAETHIAETSASQQIAANTNTQEPSASINQFANLPEIRDLPSGVLNKIPSLKYTEHNYNIHGGSVVINGTVRHANDQLIEGMVIEKILEDGMILHYENYSFKMRALNTWVNM